MESSITWSYDRSPRLALKFLKKLKVFRGLAITFKGHCSATVMYQSIPKSRPFPRAIPGHLTRACVSSIHWGIWPKMRPARWGIWLSCQNVCQRYRCGGITCTCSRVHSTEQEGLKRQKRLGKEKGKRRKKWHYVSIKGRTLLTFQHVYGIRKYEKWSIAVFLNI